MTEHDASPGEDPLAPQPAERGDAPATPSTAGSDVGGPTTGSADDSGAGSERPRHRAPNMLPGRAGRASGIERGLVRVIATGGVIGIGVAIAAILAANNVQGWIIGLVVATVSVVLSAVLWSSRQL